MRAVNGGGCDRRGNRRGHAAQKLKALGRTAVWDENGERSLKPTDSDKCLYGVARRLVMSRYGGPGELEPEELDKIRKHGQPELMDQIEKMSTEPMNARRELLLEHGTFPMWSSEFKGRPRDNDFTMEKLLNAGFDGHSARASRAPRDPKLPGMKSGKSARPASKAAARQALRDPIVSGVGDKPHGLKQHAAMILAAAARAEERRGRR